MVNELSIIIPTLNEVDYLPALLESIGAQTYAGKLEVIVVDGQSTDETIAVAHRFDHKISVLTVLETTKNVGHQRNFGAAAAKYRYLLFLDADVVLPPNLIRDVTARITTPGPFIAGVMHTAENMNLADRGIIALAYVLIGISRLARVPAVVGDFILTTKAQHYAIGGFAEDALLGEDTDYGVRSVKAGSKYLFYWRHVVYASDRRVRLVGRIKLLMIWSRGFIHVVRKGPVYPGEGYEYPFGHYPRKK